MAEETQADPLHNTGIDLNQYIQCANPEIEPSSVFNINSPYYDIKQLIDKSRESTDSKYKVLHINIQSLPAKFDGLKNILADLECNHIEIDFILMCETFLSDMTSQHYDLPGYRLICKNRQNKSRGGVAMYVKQKYNYQLREDLSIFKEGIFESVFIEINTKGEKCIVGEIYRVPNTNLSDSLNYYDTIVEKLTDFKHKVIIGTDQNLDLLKIESHKYTEDLFNILFTHSIVPTINKPTRITHNTATLIDNIYVSAQTCDNITSGILVTDLSDHFPIFTFIGHNKSFKNVKQRIKFRVLNNKAVAAINKDLKRQSWQCLHSNDASEAYSSFAKTVTKVIDKHAPETTKTLSGKNIKREPWFTKGLLKSSQTVIKLYKKQLHKPKEHKTHTSYIKYRNLYSKIKKVAKQAYYTECLKLSNGDIRKTWKTLNTLLGKTNDKTGIVDSFIINEQTVSDPKQIGDAFCDYFTNIGPKLAKNIPPSNRTKNPPQGKHVEASIFLSPTDPNEVYYIISSLKSKASTGYDGISTKLIKDIKSEIAYPLSILINKSLQEGTVPDDLKIAKVLPIFKKNDPHNVSNYRPISLLPGFSKIFEKVVFKRIYHFLQKHEALYEKQYGFRPKHSTTDAIHDFVRNIYEAIENKDHGLGIFLDFSKAFDTIDHKILIDKLCINGIRGTALKWFQSYLNNRKQFISYKESISDTQNITYRVPQGSVLGPLLFLVYINDLPNCLDYCKSIFFADDSNLFHSNTSKSLLIKHINHDLDNLDHWCKNNKLSLNIEKTHFVNFNPTENNITHLDIGENKIYSKQSTVFLGIHIDYKLNWHEHILHVQKKVRNQLFIINQVKNYLPEENLRTLYFSLIQPYLTYGISIWGGSHSTYLNKLVKSQKRAIRIIKHLGYRDHTEEHFKNLKILRLDDLYKLNMSLIMYKYNDRLLPKSLQTMFKQNQDFHSYNTRHRSNFSAPKHKSTTYHRSIMQMGPEIWNKIPDEIKKANSINTFRNKYKKYLLNQTTKRPSSAT